MEPENQLTTWTIDRGVIDRNVARGIDIVGTPAFCREAVAALEKIKKRPTGALLLTLLLQHIQADQRLGIAVRYGDEQSGSRCVSWNVEEARTQLTYMMRKNNAVGIAECMRAVLIVTGNNAAWLAHQLWQTPAYRKSGQPATGPSVQVQVAHVTAWLNHTAAFPAPFINDQALILCNSLKIVLAGTGQIVPGRGCGSRVYWRPGDSIVLTNATVQHRPSWIGLAHELIHAYHNITGQQLDNNDGDQSADAMLTTVLGEYMCVGLGPWANAPITENSIRAEAEVQRRYMY